MTQGDVMFLHRLMTAHKEVIREDCARKKLDKSEYLRRTARVDRKAQEIERSYMRHRRF